MIILGGYYKAFDRCHDQVHFDEVTNFIQRIYKNQIIENINYILLYTAAAFHDTGRLIDNYEHEQYSNIIFQRDKIVRKYFDSKERDIISGIILHHRSKYKAQSELEKIMKDADDISFTDFDRILRRIIYYKIDNFEELFNEDENHDELVGKSYKEAIFILTKKGIRINPLVFSPISSIGRILYPNDVKFYVKDKDIMQKVEEVLSEEGKHDGLV